jgi:hypothetical protein
LNTSFLSPNSIPWFIRVRGSCQANGESFFYPLTFKSINPRAYICSLRVRSPISSRLPRRPLTKGDGHPKRISKGERPVCLVELDLTLSKAMYSN